MFQGHPTTVFCKISVQRSMPVIFYLACVAGAWKLQSAFSLKNRLVLISYKRDCKPRRCYYNNGLRRDAYALTSRGLIRHSRAQDSRAVTSQRKIRDCSQSMGERENGRARGSLLLFQARVSSPFEGGGLIETGSLFERVSMGLTDRRKTVKNLVDSRKNRKILTVSRKQDKKELTVKEIVNQICYF